MGSHATASDVRGGVNARRASTSAAHSAESSCRGRSRWRASEIVSEATTERHAHEITGTGVGHPRHLVLPHRSSNGRVDLHRTARHQRTHLRQQDAPGLRERLRASGGIFVSGTGVRLRRPAGQDHSPGFAMVSAVPSYRAGSHQHHVAMLRVDARPRDR
jgi:hypothetical protein